MLTSYLQEGKWRQLSRKEEIINAVLDIFSTKGFTTEFTMSKLAESLDIGKSTIYEYFDNKDEIIKAAIYTFIGERINKVDTGDELDDLPFEQAFTKQLRVLLSVAHESRSLLEALSPGFLQKLPENMREEMKRRMEQTRDRMQSKFMSFFTKASLEGVISNDIDPNYGLVVTGMVIGSIMVFSDSRTNVELEPFIESIYQSVLKILN